MKPSLRRILIMYDWMTLGITKYITVLKCNPFYQAEIDVLNFSVRIPIHTVKNDRRIYCRA